MWWFSLPASPYRGRATQPQEGADAETMAGFLLESPKLRSKNREAGISMHSLSPGECPVVCGSRDGFRIGDGGNSRCQFSAKRLLFCISWERRQDRFVRSRAMPAPMLTSPGRLSPPRQI